MRQRLDVEMVRRGLVSSRSQAAAVIERGHVLVSGTIADKASRMVARGEPIELRSPPRFVSRGGEKLAGALDHFGVDVRGRRCLDAGSSTGGFTDCLLQAGAAEVVAVDVGRGQLDGRLRGDSRVHVFEGVNVRHLTAGQIGGRVEVVTADLSFISLAAVAPALAEVATPGAPGLFLVKPQFEAGPERVGRGGVVRDPETHLDVLRQVAEALEPRGWGAKGVVPSPIRGAKGNVEFMLWFEQSAEPTLPVEALHDAVDRANQPAGTPGVRREGHP